MFTGIIECLGKIESLQHSDSGGRLRVSLANTDAISAQLKIGSSIAVNGCCLTAVEIGRAFFCADLSQETLRKTSFAQSTPGKLVNLELPLAADGRLGGHFVQGHVDSVGRVTEIEQRGESWQLGVSIPADLQRYVTVKGSLAVDGISLTVARWHPGVAEFAIIPHTYENTNLREITAGDVVNVECDILAKYVEALSKTRISAIAGRWSVEQLMEEGF